MLGGLVNMFLFLINFIFGFYAFLIMLRFFLQWVKADFYNPLSQVVMKLTNPLLLPLRRVIPGFFGLDLSALILAYVILVIKNVAIKGIESQDFFAGYSFASGLYDLISVVITMYIYLIVISAIASWFTQGRHNPMIYAISQVTEPLLSCARRVIKPFSGIDLSPMIVMLILFCINIFIDGVWLEIKPLLLA